MMYRVDFHPVPNEYNSKTYISTYGIHYSRTLSSERCDQTRRCTYYYYICMRHMYTRTRNVWIDEVSIELHNYILCRMPSHTLCVSWCHRPQGTAHAKVLETHYRQRQRVCPPIHPSIASRCHASPELREVSMSVCVCVCVMLWNLIKSFKHHIYKALARERNRRSTSTNAAARGRRQRRRY